MQRIVLQSLLSVMVVSAAAAEPHLRGLDTVTTVGQPVAVRAKFEGGTGAFGIRPDLRDWPVQFAPLDGGTILRGRTDRDGVGSATFRADAPGVYRYQASPERRPWRTTVSRVWVLDPAKPVVVIDIDGTLSSLKEYLVPFRGGKAATYPGAPALVNDLARTHQVIYLTARDDVFDDMTREFLRRRGFPDAPVLYNDTGLWTEAERDQLVAAGNSHGTFKLATLEALQDRGVNLVLGIGNAETDAYAYEGVGIPSMIRTEERGGGPSFRFTDYRSQLRPKLIELGFLPDPQSGLVHGVGPQ